MARFIWRGVTSRPKLVIWLLPWWCCTLRKCPSGPPATQGTSIVLYAIDRTDHCFYYNLVFSPKFHFMADHSYVMIRTCLCEARIWISPFMAKEGYACGMQG